MRMQATHDEDAVAGRLELGEHAREEDELGRRVGQVAERLLRRCDERLHVGVDEVRVAERLAQLHEDVAARRVSRASALAASREKQGQSATHTKLPVFLPLVGFARDEEDWTMERIAAALRSRMLRYRPRCRTVMLTGTTTSICGRCRKVRAAHRDGGRNSTHERRQIERRLLGAAQEIRLEHAANLLDALWRELGILLHELVDVVILVRVCIRE